MQSTTLLDSLYTAMGFLGVGMVLFSYFLLQAGKVKPESQLYAALNIGGSCGILVSLIPAFNLPSMAMQLCWITITLFGVIRRRMKKL